MALQIETPEPKIEVYYEMLKEVHNLLLVTKSEIARLRNVKARCRDQRNITKLDDRINDLTKVRMYLENVVKYARKCRREGYLDEAIEVLKEVLGNV